MDDEELADQAGTRFAVLRSLCYPSKTPTSHDRTVETFSRATTTHARTNGYQLEKISPSHFHRADAETQFVTLLHEVTHANGGAGYGRGKSSHNPDFWEEFQSNFNTIVEEQRCKSVVESLFSDLVTDFDWHRARYRAVQHVSQIDKRSETVEERQEKLANAIDYDAYYDFEGGDWGLCMCGRDDSIHPDETAVKIRSPTKRFADDFTDEQILDFVRENDGMVPMPLVVLNVDEYRTDGPQIVETNDEWDVPLHADYQSRLALAAQERLGHGYSGLCTELVTMHPDKSMWEQSSPVSVERFPTGERVAVELRSRF